MLGDRDLCSGGSGGGDTVPSPGHTWKGCPVPVVALCPWERLLMGTVGAVMFWSYPRKAASGAEPAALLAVSCRSLTAILR